VKETKLKEALDVGAIQVESKEIVLFLKEHYG
jgi:hypothetical protein